MFADSSVSSFNRALSLPFHAHTPPAYGPKRFIAVHVHTFAQKLFKTLFFVFLLTPVIGWTVAVIINRVDKARTKKLRDEINLSRWEAIQEIGNKFSEIKGIGATGTEFDKKFHKLKKHVFSHPVSHHAVKTQGYKVQKAIANLYSCSGCQQLSDKEDLRIKFIGELAIAISGNAKGGKAFQKWGRKIVKENPRSDGPGNYTFLQLGSLLARAFNRSRSTTMDFIGDILVWGATHPLRLFEAVKGLGVIGWDSRKDFNPYLNGNINIAGWDFLLTQKENTKILRFAFGPGPGISSDRLLETKLEFLKTAGGIHLQHSLEHPLERGELARLKRLKGIEERYPGTFRLFMTPMNGKSWRMENEFLQWKTPSEFVRLYRNFACTGNAIDQKNVKAYRKVPGKGQLSSENGFYVGKDALTDNQFEMAFDSMEEILGHNSNENAYICKMVKNGKKGKTLLGKGIQVFTQGLIAMGAVTKVMLDSNQQNNCESLLTFGQACREDIDRGVVLNVATKLLFYLYQGKELKREDVDRIVGEAMGRAELVLNRRILQDKFEGLVSFIYLVGSYPQTVIKEKIGAYLQKAFSLEESPDLSCKPVD